VRSMDSILSSRAGRGRERPQVGRRPGELWAAHLVDDADRVRQHDGAVRRGQPIPASSDRGHNYFYSSRECQTAHGRQPFPLRPRSRLPLYISWARPPSRLASARLLMSGHPRGRQGGTIIYEGHGAGRRDEQA